MSKNTAQGSPDGPRLIYGRVNENWSGPNKANEKENVSADKDTASKDFISSEKNDYSDLSFAKIFKEEDILDYDTFSFTDDQGVERNINYAAVMGPFTINGYVEILPDHPFYDPVFNNHSEYTVEDLNPDDENYDEVKEEVNNYYKSVYDQLDNFDVHGGITFFNSVKTDDYDQAVGIIGFDTNHYGDSPHPDSDGYKEYNRNFPIGLPFGNRPGIVWSQESVMLEAERLAEQIAKKYNEKA